jgi:thymidylate synthase ThyX
MNWQPGTDRHFLYKNTKMKVELLEIFGNDDMVANAARVSFGKEASNYTVEQNEKLIKYLAEHGHHTSPFSPSAAAIPDNLPYLCRKAVV